MRPLRILLVTWEYPPVVEGGLARHVGKLAEQLVRGGADVHVLTRGPQRESAEQDGVVVHRVPEPAYPRELGGFVDWVARLNDDLHRAGHALLEEHEFDVVHGHDWLVATAAKRLADFARRPLVVTVHATEYGRHQGWVHVAPQSDIHRTERWMVQGSDQVIVCSHYMRGHVADLFAVDEERIAVVPNGIDPADLSPVADLDTLRAEFAAPGEQLILLAGRLVYEKGFHLALEALADVTHRVPGVRFVIAGSGTAEADLRAQAAELGLADRGRFVGWIGDDVLHSLYRIADLTVVPSLYEPFGLVALEAMASGCPCVVADTGGLREVVPPGERVGLRFNGGDAAHLGTMIERLLTDRPLRDRLVAEASEHVLRFDWTDIAAQTRAIYETLDRAAEPVPTDRR